MVEEQKWIPDDQIHSSLNKRISNDQISSSVTFSLWMVFEMLFIGSLTIFSWEESDMAYIFERTINIVDCCFFIWYLFVNLIFTCSLLLTLDWWRLTNNTTERKREHFKFLYFSIRVQQTTERGKWISPPPFSHDVTVSLVDCSSFIWYIISLQSNVRHVTSSMWTSKTAVNTKRKWQRLLLS